MESNKTRTDLLNFLIEKHGLKSYLEIGLQNAAQNFDKIKCDYKVSVDPDPNAKADQCRTSDDFFKYTQDHVLINPVGTFKPFDLIFIDGLHTAEQVKKDFENALQILSPNGFIVLHDVNPENEARTLVPRPTPTGTWNGSCYKFAAQLKSRAYFTVDIDHGVACYQKKEGFPLIKSNEEITWDYFDKNRKKLLNLISWDEFVSLNTHV